MCEDCEATNATNVSITLCICNMSKIAVLLTKIPFFSVDFRSFSHKNAGLQFVFLLSFDGFVLFFSTLTCCDDDDDDDDDD